jgi:integrase
MNANLAEPSSVVWLDTELFGPLPLPADPALRSDTEAILARARELARRSKATETLRSYRTAWTQWCGWCELMGYRPLGGDALAVGIFLAHLSRTKSLATARTRLAAVATAHRIAGVALDTKAGPIANVLEGFKREQGVKPLKQATPLLVDVLKRLLGTYTKDRPADLRDKALVLTGFAGALRRSEIVALDVADVDSVPQGVVLHLARSKTDQHGKGELIAIHRGTDSEFCAVTALERWIDLRGRKPGPLFTRLHKGGRMTDERLRPQAVALALKRAALASGLNPSSFSGHSLRAGLATSAALAGADLKDIMAQTRHRSHDIALRYIRRAEIWKNNVTELLFSPPASNEGHSEKSITRADLNI